MKKNADLIVLNSPEEALGGETNVVTLVEGRSVVELPEASKREVAEHILDRVMEIRGDAGQAANLKLASAPHRLQAARGGRLGPEAGEEMSDDVRNEAASVAHALRRMLERERALGTGELLAAGVAKARRRGVA